ncbi:Cytochrome c oxidase subunit 3 [Poriferisphaera corsica]|uniref:Cytochrome c oxidase subunit 3 n=1 Tax=Poriferisphaera corsica TaxID=2528020 RepID=A0A517YXV5_9BACT|nr:cytochrome c oxidase subunit 3 [Poriferisphaera corsica]QDU35046.1 Cytochrome c oxidase subunit 3 [Poriferisphaera corsica]
MNKVDEHHDPHLAHHFDTPVQQYSSAKVGMWVFLATEILMFGGLFCAYAVYRGTHPEVFLYANHFLDTNLGAINTVVLLTSSLTMAWAVRAAQLGQQKLLVGLLFLTLLGGFGFMGIKTIEYTSKYKHGLWVGTENAFYYKSDSFTNPEKLVGAVEYGESHNAVTPSTESTDSLSEQIKDVAQNDEQVNQPQAVLPTDAQTNIPEANQGPVGLSTQFGRNEGDAAAYNYPEKKPLTYEDLTPQQRTLVSQFFQIYFLMTGLHGIHVLVGMALIFWLLIRSMLGTFGPKYFVPVDLVGLYWHIVDLIWIFLFPLLYLIH